MKFSQAISRLNHLTQMIARENFIILSRQESNKSHCNCSVIHIKVEQDNVKECAFRYSLVSPCPFVRLWLLSLSQVPDWTKEPAVVYLMDIVLRTAFFHSDAREMVFHILKQLHQVMKLFQVEFPVGRT
jgi:hypothetical protein